MFSFIQLRLASVSISETSKHYKQYVLSVKLFAKNKESELKSESAKLAASLKSVRAEKRKVIEHKAGLVKDGNYDKHSRKHFDGRIEEL